MNVPGFLLLFKKTSFLGAVLLVPALLAVFLINIAYGFLPHMKIFTGTLFFLDLLLLYPQRAVFIRFITELLSVGRFSLRELILNVFMLASLLFLIVHYLM